MRFILVDYARGQASVKRGGNAQQVMLDEAMIVSEDRMGDMLALDGALNRLAAFDQRKSKIAVMRFFSGLTIEESAEVLGVSSETVMRDWRLARAWLRGELSA
jgi:RNA polymerase sigma factor (TIGR02999 family)